MPETGLILQIISETTTISYNNFLQIQSYKYYNNNFLMEMKWGMRQICSLKEERNHYRIVGVKHLMTYFALCFHAIQLV